MEPSPLPIACTLDAPNLQQRKGVFQKILNRATQRAPLTDGYEFTFPSDAIPLAELAEIIPLEQKCCAFLRFTIIIEPASGPLRLQLTGPEGTKDFLASLFPQI